jgi:hypothetical protein
MIVSASYRTDIPAFYAEWFRTRFRAGFARVANPYGGAPATVPLRAGVEGFVFWTRNPEPFLPVLDEVRRAGLPFVVQVTATGYPRALEASVIAWARAVALMRRIAAEHGPRAVVWRFDPILHTTLTPAPMLRDTFARLADALAGAVDEVAMSFATPYRKTARTLAAAARLHGFAWWDPAVEDKRALAAALAAQAAARGMAATLCAQPALGIIPGARAAACVDARRLEDVAAGWGAPRAVPARVRGNRPGCLCHESRDIGAYDTCPHGCVYCYAVGSRALAKRRLAAHDPAAAALIPGEAGEAADPPLFAPRPGA